MPRADIAELVQNGDEMRETGGRSCNEVGVEIQRKAGKWEGIQRSTREATSGESEVTQQRKENMNLVRGLRPRGRRMFDFLLTPICLPPSASLPIAQRFG